MRYVRRERPARNSRGESKLKTLTDDSTRSRPFDRSFVGSKERTARHCGLRTTLARPDRVLFVLTRNNPELVLAFRLSCVGDALLIAVCVYLMNEIKKCDG